MFGSETIVKDLDLNCLLFLRRNYGPFFFALDVANVCTDRTYKFELAGLMDQKKIANTVPMIREFPPKRNIKSKYNLRTAEELNSFNQLT